MKRFPGPLLLALFGTVSPFPAQAAEPERNGTLSVVLENDLFYNVDRHYTNGVGFIWAPDRHTPTPEWALAVARHVPWFPKDGDIRHGYAFGQSMFTPSDIKIANPPLSERPYAGWLYGSIGLGAVSGQQFDLLYMSVGMVGPASLAEQSQKFIHKVIGAAQPRGWDTQLHDEPGIVLTYQRSWRGLAKSPTAGTQLDLTPHIGAALGNVFTYANAGLTLRFGERLPNDFGPPRIQPGLPGGSDFAPVSDFGWYAFAGIEGRLVARNIFLDGNTFRDSRSVDKIPLVGDLQYGVVFDWSSIRVSYTHVLRGREYRTQNGRDDFGALSLSVKF